MRRRVRIRPVKHDKLYGRIWRIVDGALLDCVRQHPEYFVPTKIRTMRESICKRVVGAIKGSTLVNGGGG